MPETPSVIIHVDNEITPETIEKLREAWRAAYELEKHQPVRVLALDPAALEDAVHAALDPLLDAFRQLILALAAPDAPEPTDAVMLACDKIQLALLPFGMKDAGRPPLAGDK